MSKAEYKRLGDYIREVNVRNRDLKVTNLLGVNLSKQFFPSIANIVGTDLSKYKIIGKGQFGCKFMSVGRDGILPISLMQDDKPAIISSAYYVFEVKDQKVLLPEYLMMWLRRPEFDRQLWFYSGGDVRGGVNFDDFCEMPIVIPPITRQREIVSEYETLTNRIRLNNKMIQHLEATAQALYRKMFVEPVETPQCDVSKLPEGWRMGTIQEIANVKNGKSIVPTEGNVPVYGGNGIVGYTNISNANGIVVIGRVGINCGSLFLHQRECYVNDNSMMAIPNDNDLIFLYWTLKQIDLNSQSEGSGQPLLTQSIIYNQECVIPDITLRAEFNDQGQIIYRNKVLMEQENEKLIELQSLLLAKMGQ